jgi:hypothetical protein
MRSFTTYMFNRTLLGWPNKSRYDGRCRYGAFELREIRMKFWFENLEGRSHSEDIEIDGKIILERIFQKQGRKLCTEGFTCLRIATSDGLL